MMHLFRLLSSLIGTTSGGDTLPRSFWMPPQSSTVAGSVDWIYFFIYWICVFFFVIIVALMVVFVVKYRRKDVHQKAERSASHHTALELTWTIIPLLLVIAIFYVGLRGYVNMRAVPANPYEVNVIAQKWSWTFKHRNGATETNELTVPAGRPVRLVMESVDVIHSLYIPAFRVKQDVVPGRYTDLWFEADEGIYQLFCAEYCGQQHSTMAATVNVLPLDEFDVAIEEAANWIENEFTEETLYLAGYRLFNRCASCHSIDGSRQTGPSFWETHDLWGKERQFADGTSVVVDENYVRDSILNPGNHIVETYPNVMPTFQGQLKPLEVTALVQFIKRLDEVVSSEGDRLAE